MSVGNFLWDKKNETVSWSFNGLNIKQRYDDMFFAYLNVQDNYVLIKVGKSFMEDQIYYLSFEGNKIFTFDRANDKISWRYTNGLIEVVCENMEDAKMYLKKDIIITITVTNKEDKRIKGFALDGTLLFDKEPPEGYKFKYLSTSNKLPTVVCDGGKANEDAYGRCEFHFGIDTKVGDMSKVSLAY